MSKQVSKLQNALIISAGVIFGVSIQFISHVKQQGRDLSDILVHYYPRIIISGLIGAILFILLNNLFKKIYKKNQKNNFLSYLNILVLYFFLGANGLDLFLLLLIIALIIFIVRNLTLRASK